MDLNSVDVSTGQGGTLTIAFSNLFNGPFNPGAVNTMMSATTAGTIKFQTLLDGVVINNTGPLGPGAVSATASSGFASSAGLLEVKAIINHKGAGTTSFDVFAQVPEPGTMLLAGLGLAGLGLFGRRRKA